jgi:hypothetical protein
VVRTTLDADDAYLNAHRGHLPSRVICGRTAARLVMQAPLKRVHPARIGFMAGRTLYLRIVPLDVVERHERLAERAGLSLTAFAVRELAEASRRAENAALFDTLPDTTVSTEEIVAAQLHAGPARSALREETLVACRSSLLQLGRSAGVRGICSA